MVRQLSDASDTILRSKVRSRHGQLFPKEYRPDTATRKAGLLERVTDDLSPQGGNLGDCLVSWLDIIGECEKECGQIAVLLKSVPREPRDHLVLDSPHLLSVRSKVPAMQELVQHWYRSRKTRSPQQPPVEIAAVSTTSSKSETSLKLLGWYRSWSEKGHGNEETKRKASDSAQERNDKKGERCGEWQR